MKSMLVSHGLHYQSPNSKRHPNSLASDAFHDYNTTSSCRNIVHNCIHDDAWANPTGSLNARINAPVSAARMAQTRYGNPIQTPPSSKPLLRSHPRTGELTRPMIVSIIDTVVFSVATVCGSTTAFSSARQSVVNPVPRLVTMREMMNNHTVGAKAVRKFPAMTKISEARISIKSLFRGSSPRFFTRIQEPAGNSTRSTTAAVMLLTVETYVAYLMC